jgi:hypothetical protein
MRMVAKLAANLTRLPGQFHHRRTPYEKLDSVLPRGSGASAKRRTLTMNDRKR